MVHPKRKDKTNRKREVANRKIKVGVMEGRSEGGT